MNTKHHSDPARLVGPNAVPPARSENVRRLRNELRVGLLHNGLLPDSHVVAELADELDRHGVLVGVPRT